jgi:hypothetical protein
MVCWFLWFAFRFCWYKYREGEVLKLE